MIALLLAGAVFAREIGLDEALRLAAAGNAEVRAAEMAERAEEARALAVATRFLPTFSATGSALWWNAPLEAAVVDPAACAGLDAAMQPLCEQFLQGLADEPVLLREANTRQLEVRAVQPLTGLWSVAEGHRARRALARAAGADLDDTRSSVQVRVTEAWLLGLRTRALAEVADEGVAAIEAALARAEAFHAAGVIGETDVLQARLALARARLDARRARAGARSADRLLGILVGEEDVQPAPLAAAEPPPAPGALSADLAERARHRPDVEALRARVDAARAQVAVARAALLPQVAVVGSWTKNQGLGSFSAATESYVGLGLTWDAWAWGRRWAELRAARFDAARAEAGLRGLEAGAVVEAEAALSDAELAREAWETHRDEVELARANLDLARARYEAHAIPMTDLLEAQALFARARAEEVGAWHDALLALARVQDALGLPVDPLRGLSAGETAP